MVRVAILCNLLGLIALSACSSSFSEQPLYRNQDARTSPRSTTLPDTKFRVLYSFGKTTDDAWGPYPAPIASNGNLYGTTSNGGKANDGTVYKISTTGVETVLHSFNGADGKTPWAGLLYYSGAFYGTTQYGGTKNDGTIYRISPGGSFKSLYSFHGGERDGNGPVGVLTALNGTLYGTTGTGGPYNGQNGGFGSVFSVTTGGSEHVLHFFRGSPDGAYPWGTLTLVKGMLYGTSFDGGKYDAGSVYRVTTSGSVKILHSFKGSDGEQLESNVMYEDGWLYGTAVRGGAYGFGTVFKVGLGGQFSTLYSFDGAANGCHPISGLRSLNGSLFGLTTGSFTGSSCSSAGTIYAITPSGSLTTTHTFDGRNGGGEPIDFSGLTNVGGKLYGTTWAGGKTKAGIFFSMTP